MSFPFFHFSGSNTAAITKQLITENDGPVFHLANAHEIYQSIHIPITTLCSQRPIPEMELSSSVYDILCKMKSRLNTSVHFANSHHSYIFPTIQYMKTHIQETGSSPIEYFSLLKLEHAKLMLTTTDSSISEIAEALGYSSSASFINAFQSRIGISPVKYRKQLLATL